MIFMKLKYNLKFLTAAILLMCICALAFFASACGEKNETGDTPAAENQSEEPETAPATAAPTNPPAPTEPPPPPPPPLVINPPDDSVDIFGAAGISRDNLLAYWQFGAIGADDKIADETGSGRDLFVAPDTAQIITEGAFRGASLLLAADQRAEFFGRTDDGTKLPELAEFTVNAWVRIDDDEDLGECAPIFENDSVFRICITGNGGHAVLADENDSWYGGGNAGSWSDGSFYSRLGEWQMLTLTFDGEAITTYLDGEFDGYNEQSGGGGIVKPASRFFIGDPKAAWGSGFNGAVDEYSILAECLSEEQVLALFMAYAGSQGE